MVSLVGHETLQSFDQVDSFVVYRIKVEVLKKEFKTISSAYEILRRFSDFNGLHDDMSKRF